MDSRPFRLRSEVAIGVATSQGGGSAALSASRATTNNFWLRSALLGFLLGVAACAASLLGGSPPAAKAALDALLLLRKKAALLQAPPSPPCAASGLCSLGRVRAWHGDLSRSPSFREALRARAFKKEVVLLCTEGRSLDFTLQPLAQLARLGMAHALLLADTRETCERAREAVERFNDRSGGRSAQQQQRRQQRLSLGCGWYGEGESSDNALLLPPRIQGAFRLWALRLRTALRAVRLRYNVLVLDADTVLFADPYPYLKHPALLGKYHWVSQPESAGGDAEGGGGFLNGGVYYVQNAAPSGAAAFLLYEATRRMLRWDDDERATLRSYWRRVGGKGAGAAAGDEEEDGGVASGAGTEPALKPPPQPPACCDADQDLLNDVFRTMRTGTLTSACALRCALDGVWRPKKGAATADAEDEKEPPEATRARLEALITRIENEEAGCDDYWRTDALSSAPEWSWPVILGPTSAGFPDDEVAAAFEQDEQEAREEREERAANNNSTNTTTTRSSKADAARRAHYARRNLEDPARVRWGELRVMNARGFDPGLGGRFYPPPPPRDGKGGRPYSSALDAQLLSDCPRCPPLWPDPEDPLMARRADAAPRERLALMPPWLLTSWQAHGWRGYWAASPLAGAPGRRGGGGGNNAAAAEQRLVQTIFPLFPAPSQLLGHVWFVPEATASLKVVKRALQMASGSYDWPLALGALGSGAFSACRDGSDLPLGAPGSRFKPAGGKCGGEQGLRVLALHPQAERALLSGAASWDEYASVAAGLADAAAALGRVPAWPSVDCAAAEAWALQESGEGDGAGGVLVVEDAELARRRPLSARRPPPYGGLSPRVIVDHRGRCFPWIMTIPDCLNLGRGMLPWELDAWLAHQAPAIAAVTMPAAAASGGGGGGDASSSSAWTPEPREGVNVVRLRLDASDATRKADLAHLEAAQREMQGLEEEEVEDGSDDDSNDDDGGGDYSSGGRFSSSGPSSSSSSIASSSLLTDDDPSAAPPPPVPGWRVPLLLVDAARLQRAAEALGGAHNPALYLSSPLALAPGSLSDANDDLGGRARLAGARSECFPLVPGALAELRRNELNARAEEARRRADDEAARAEGGDGGDGVAASARTREAELRREAARLEGRARDEDALHYLLHDMSEPTRRTGLLSWAAEGLWSAVPASPSAAAAADSPS